MYFLKQSPIPYFLFTMKQNSKKWRKINNMKTLIYELKNIIWAIPFASSDQ